MEVVLVAGAAYMVYPGAVHSRFEHSLGVYWLAAQAVYILHNRHVSIFSFNHYGTFFWNKCLFNLFPK